MTSKYQDVPVELLRQLLRYDPDTGFLFWRERPVSMFEDRGGRYTAEWCCNTFNNKHAGKRGFTSKNTGGYHAGGIFGKVYSAHRVVWALHYGSWPPDVGLEIDHINRDRQDNRIENLRLVTKALNNHNKVSNRGNSPYIGVNFYKPTGRWVARVVKDKKIYHLGTFDDPEEAAKVRDAKTKELYGKDALLNFP